MRDFGSRTSTKDWIRLAAKIGLLFTEPKVRAAIGDQIKESVGNMSDTVSSKYSDISDTVADKYEDAADRLEAAAEALQGKSAWPSHLAGFLLGVGVGAGLGILLAPAAGSETREAFRDHAAEVTNRIRRSVTRMPSTGTEG
jgi:gas vesicle protein